MRQLFKIWSLVILGLVLVSLQEHYSNARIIGTNPTGSSSDLWCNGGRIRGNTTISGTEVCQDSSGNWIPTTGNTQTLGTSSLPWGTVFTQNEVTTGYNELAILTTTQLSLRSDPIGAIFLAQESVGGSLVTNAYNVCVSTAVNPASYVYLAVSTSAAAIAGQACSK